MAAILPRPKRTIYDSGQKAINATLADAITAKRKVDREARSNYIELFDNYEAGPRIKQKLINAFQNKDYNSMSAALEVMYKRGDKDDIGDVLRRYSKEVTAKRIFASKKNSTISVSPSKQKISMLRNGLRLT